MDHNFGGRKREGESWFLGECYGVKPLLSVYPFGTDLLWGHHQFHMNWFELEGRGEIGRESKRRAK